MKLFDLEKANSAAKALAAAEKRLTEVYNWGHCSPPMPVEIDGNKLLIFTPNCFDKIRECVVDLIKTEMLIHKDKLRELGIEE